MGVSIDIHCKSCGYKKELMLGKGKHFSNPDINILINIIESLKEAEQLAYLRDNKKAALKGYPLYRLCECPKCSTLHSRFYYELILDNKDVFSKQYKCPDCQTTLVFIENNFKLDLSKYKCPNCGEHTLDNSGITTLWD